MAYEDSSVPVSRSQEAIRKLLRENGAVSFAAVSDTNTELKESFEGFETRVPILNHTYHIRIMAKVPKAPDTNGKKSYSRGFRRLTDKQKIEWTEQAERRIWRVLYYHMKDIFEAANSGVMDFRELILPYIVTANNRTIGEMVVPKLAAMVDSPGRLLTAGEQVSDSA